MDKTLHFDINGTNVMVDDLPKPIRDMITLFDKMRDESSDVVYRHNVLRIAIGTLNANIIKEAQTFLDGSEDVDNSLDVSEPLPSSDITDGLDG